MAARRFMLAAGLVALAALMLLDAAMSPGTLYYYAMVTLAVTCCAAALTLAVTR